MKSISVPDIHDRLVKAFRAFDCDTMDKLHDSVDKVYMSLFERLMSGDIDGFYYEQHPESASHNMYLYTRSVKTEGIQRSVIWRRNGKDIPLSDSQYQDFEDMKRDGYSNGVIVYFYRLEDL